MTLDEFVKTANLRGLASKEIAREYGKGRDEFTEDDLEAVYRYQNAVYAWNEDVRLWLVDPPTAKIAVGAPGRGGGKDAVRDALLKNKEFATEVEVDLLDEHSVDSIAIGWWGLKKWIEENQPE